MTNKLELLLHPLRLRIVTTISNNQMTAQQLAQALPDVAQATLYRHIGTLHSGGVLQIIEERAVRGTVEKVYALANPQDLFLTAEDLATATKDDHARYFSVFLMSIMGDFMRYLNDADEHPNFAQDGIGYHTLALYMADEDMQAFGVELQTLLQKYAMPQPDKDHRLFSFVVMPAAKATTPDEDDKSSQE